MSYLPAPDDLTALTDEALGMWVLNSFGYGIVRERGFPDDQIDAATVLSFVEALAGIESLNARDAAIVSALRLAAKDQFAIAGRIVREHLATGAEALRNSGKVEAVEKRAASFNSSGVKAQQQKGAERRQAVLAAAKAVLQGRARKPSVRELAGLVAAKVDMPADTVRGHLQALRKTKKLD